MKTNSLIISALCLLAPMTLPAQLSVTSTDAKARELDAYVAKAVAEDAKRLRGTSPTLALLNYAGT